MFRPLTFITLVMACASGLYLYQVKHQAQVLDRQIDRAVKAIETTRAQARELSATWTLQGNPSRLQQLASQFLPADRPVQPSQFVALANLDTRLPAPRALDAAPTPDGVTGTGTDSDTTPDMAAPAAVTDPSASPTAASPSPDAPAPDARVSEPVKPPPAPPVVALARPADRKPAETPRPVREAVRTQDFGLAPAHAAPPRPAPQPVVAELERPPARAWPRAPMPIEGSLLGMAHAGSAAPPVPRPLPIVTAPMNNGNH